MTDLDAMLRSLDVSVRRDLYAVVTVEVGSPAAADAHAVIAEDECPTLVLPVDRAAAHGLEVGPEFAWLTLTIHSSLEAVGLTAAFSAALGQAGISCNVLAGYFHDHLLVPAAEVDRAVRVLRGMRDRVD